MPMGGVFTDSFQRNRAPNSRQLIAELVGIAFSCACLNANLIASLTPRLYMKTRRGQAKTRYVQAYERNKGYSPTTPVSAKQLTYLSQHSRGVRNKGVATIPGYALASDTMVEEVVDHPLLDLLNEPETTTDDLGLSGFDHRWATQLYMEGIGRSYWLIERQNLSDGSSVPKHLWLLQGQYISEVKDEKGIKFLSHYEYAGKKYGPEDIIKLHIPDLAHLRTGGFSPTMAAYEKLQLVRKGDAQIGSILDNMGFPGLIATAKQSEMGASFGPAEAKRMQSALNGLLKQGGYGGTVVLPEALELIFPHWKPNETLTLERYQQYKTDILNNYDIPSSVLERNDANLASAKTGDYAHAKYAGVPRATRYEWAINSRLVPLYDNDKRFFVAFDNVIPDDELFAFEQVKTAGQMGAFEVNEIRQAAGFPDLEGDLGKSRYINGNLIGDDGVPIMAVQQGPSPGTTNNPPPGDAEKKYFILNAELDARLRRLESQSAVSPVSVSIPSAPESVEGEVVGHLSKTVLELVRTVEKIAKKPRAALPAPEPVIEVPPEPEVVVTAVGRAKAALIQAGYSEDEIAAKTVVNRREHCEL